MASIIQQYRYSLICAIGIFILIAIPGTMIPPVPTFSEWLQWDKVSHLLFFGGFCYAMLADVCVYRGYKLAFRHLIIIFFISVGYGAFTEWFQHLPFVKRDGNMFDWYADILGALLGIPCYCLIHRNKLQLT